MNITIGQLRLLQVARRQLGLREDQWRSILVRCGNVASATELEKDDFPTIMEYLRYLGFDPVKPHGESYGDRPGFATRGQVELIRELWREYCRAAAFEEEAFNKWLAAKWHVTSLRFLTAEAARKVITALKAMKARPRKAA
jgi:hypothetical protein